MQWAVVKICILIESSMAINRIIKSPQVENVKVIIAICQIMLWLKFKVFQRTILLWIIPVNNISETTPTPVKSYKTTTQEAVFTFPILKGLKNGESDKAFISCPKPSHILFCSRR